MPRKLSGKIVYYHPRAIKENPDRGSDLRVKKMLGALQRLGHEVIVIAGDAKTRHKKIKSLRDQVESGLKIDYVYGESTNAPIFLADKNFLPSNCARDYLFFAWLKKKEIPFGIFYRDIYWRFDFFKKQLIWPLNVILKPMYYLDWYMYSKYSDVFFLPSAGMNNHLPRKREKGSFKPLAPGFDNEIQPRRPFNSNDQRPLSLLYVGGIEPTVYDISNLLSLIAKRHDVHLTICCRAQEWKKYGHIYERYLGKNTELVHVKNKELESYYHNSDLFVMLMERSTYMEFAMPVKFSETIGYAVPIISLDQKEVAKHINSLNIGWVIETIDQLDSLIDKISEDRSLLANKYDNLMANRPNYTWDARATEIDNYLSY